MTQELINKNQEYWDVCLIKTWRNAGTVSDAMKMFHQITGLRAYEQNLLRKPGPTFPAKIGIRSFMASYLPKISKRLWDQPQEKDILLFNALKKSNYDTQKSAVSDKTLNNLGKNITRNNKRIRFEHQNYQKRNQATDWTVNK